MILIVGTTGSVTLTHLLHREVGGTDVSFFKLELSLVAIVMSGFITVFIKMAGF